MLQTLPPPVCSSPSRVQPSAAGSAASWGMGSNFQRRAPVRASKARTSPRGLSARQNLVLSEPPMTTRSATVTGGAENWTSPSLSFWCVVVDVRPDVHGAPGAETRAGPARHGIEGDQAQILRAREDAVLADRAGRRRSVLPVGHAPAQELVALGSQFDVRVVDPALLAGDGVERDDAIHRRAQDQRLPRRLRHQDGRHVQGRQRAPVRVAPDVPGAVAPGQLQAPDVAPVDLGQG